jgi:hypothetical protein
VIKKLLDKLPFWDKALAKKMQPLGPVLDIGLLLVAALCIWAVVARWEAQYKALVLAFLISP